MKNCKICNESFKPYRSNSLTCDKQECRKKRKALKEIEYQANKTAQIPIIEKQCKNCNNIFMNRETAKKLYCSDKCKTQYVDNIKYSRYKDSTELAKKQRHRDLNGLKFNMLTVLNRAGSSRNGSRLWHCECECGTKKTYSTSHLVRKVSPVKSCGCLNFRKGKDNPHFTGYEGISSGWWHNHVVRSANGKSDSKSTRKPLSLTVTIKDAWKLFIKQDRKCALSGLPIQIDAIAKHNTASIDRIDSEIGYEFDNIQWVHKHINIMKNKFDQNYFIELCKKISIHYPKK